MVKSDERRFFYLFKTNLIDFKRRGENAAFPVVDRCLVRVVDEADFVATHRVLDVESDICTEDNHELRHKFVVVKNEVINKIDFLTGNTRHVHT